MIGLLQIEDLKVEIEYKQVKNIRLTVYPPDGRIRISAPLRADPGFIRNFVLSRKLWIEKHQLKFRNRSGKGSHRPGILQNGGIHFIWGVPHTLEIIERSGRPGILFADGRMGMYVRPGTTMAGKQDLLDKWYRRIVSETAPALIQKWEPAIGVKVTKCFYRKMKSRWGSCNHTRHTIRLNTELAKKPLACLEYVIVHEMLHILEPSHNRNFYRLMNQFIPSWKAIRKGMNTGTF
jgi:predicted metal-dependent hydrolase